jgi:hypothetical protein
MLLFWKRPKTVMIAAFVSFARACHTLYLTSREVRMLPKSRSCDPRRLLRQLLMITDLGRARLPFLVGHMDVQSIEGEFNILSVGSAAARLFVAGIGRYRSVVVKMPPG